jgi:membrane-bound metal-dependent hydrolase YbcI (DUF457 family)
MPFTPFHFGPGALIKAYAPRHVSFTVFAFSQVLIDIEPLYYMLHREYPIHRFFHSYIGATLIVVAAYLLGRPICGLVLTAITKRLKFTIKSFSSATRTIQHLPALLGAAAGAYSHVLLDSIMHSDIRPFAPFFEYNYLFLSISVAELHAFCVVAGLFGTLVLCFRWLETK